MVRVSFVDEKALIRIPDLLTEDATPTVIGDHCRSHLRKYKGWWIEMDVWNTGGAIHLPRKHNIMIRVTKV